jgi:hypothetical protein
MTTSHTVFDAPVHLEQPMPLAEMSVAQIAAMPAAHLQQAHANLLAMQSMVKAVLDRMQTALEQRYAELAQAARLANGRDFGVCHLDDGELRVSVDLPKKVSWDQTQLAAIAARIADAGDRVQDYINIDYSVSESRFNNWPPALKEQFAAARTVKPGKPSYRLALQGGERGAGPTSRSCSVLEMARREKRTRLWRDRSRRPWPRSREGSPNRVRTFPRRQPGQIRQGAAPLRQPVMREPVASVCGHPAGKHRRHAS